MSTNKDHIIQKAILRLKLRDKARAYDIQSQFIAAFNAEALPALEEILNRYGPSDQVIQIDRLELNLGNLNLSELNSQLRAKIAESVGTALIKALEGLEGGPSMRKMTVEDSDWDRWMAFLQTGQVPWEVNVSDFAPNALLRKLLADQPMRLLQAMPMLVANRNILERMSLQLSPDLLLELVTRLRPSLAGYAQPLQEHLRALVGTIKGLPQAHARRAAFAWALLLQWATGETALDLPPAQAKATAFLPHIQQFAKTYLGSANRQPVVPPTLQVAEKPQGDAAENDAEWEQWLAFMKQEGGPPLSAEGVPVELGALFARILERQRGRVLRVMPFMLAQPTIMRRVRRALPKQQLDQLLALLSPDLEQEVSEDDAHVPTLDALEPISPKSRDVQETFEEGKTLLEPPDESAENDAEWEQWLAFMKQEDGPPLTAEGVPIDLGVLFARLLERQRGRVQRIMPFMLAQPAILRKVSRALPKQQLHQLLALLSPGLEQEVPGYVAHIRTMNAWEPIFPKTASEQETFVRAMLLYAISQSETEIARAEDGLEHCLPILLAFAMHNSTPAGRTALTQKIKHRLATSSLEDFVALFLQMRLDDRPHLKPQLRAALKLGESSMEWREFLRQALAEALEKLLAGKAMGGWGEALYMSILRAVQGKSTHIQASWDHIFGEIDLPAELPQEKAQHSPTDEPRQPQPVPLPKGKTAVHNQLPAVPASPDGYYIDNAGIVLLNPFFQPCFEDLGWYKAGEFVDDEAREDALMLLAYMATGEKDIAEVRLPLLKLLMGMDLDQPVRAYVDLPGRAYAEAETLMTAANAHWEKAGKLTPDQFRAAFLMREGRLNDLEGGWNLKVDRQTIDILLEFLPWGFGTIKLPWMRRILTVDW